jgi:hypothetical protein
MGELIDPEVVPEAVIFPVRNTGMEADFSEFPSLSFGDRGRQGHGIIIGIAIAEGEPGGVIEVLAVEEGNGPLRRRFDEHGAGPKNR